MADSLDPHSKERPSISGNGETSINEPSISHMHLSGFAATGWAALKQSLAQEKDRAQRSVDMKSIGLDQFAISEKTQTSEPIEHPRFNTENRFEQPARTVELHQLRNGSGQHETADAVVRVPNNFDPTKPIHLVIYNHGYGDSAASSYVNAKLEQQFQNAPPNTVLIVPEWQAFPASRSSADGRFGENGRFKNLVDEAFSKTPGLQGLNMRNVGDIALIGHSAGYKGVERELYNNGLSDKVNSVTMLDAMYDPTGLDPWLRNNIHELSNGTKHYVNISNDTFQQSRAQAGRIRTMLQEAHLPSSNVYEDYHNSDSVMGHRNLQLHPIAFKFSEARVPGKGTHMSIPDLYVQQVAFVGNSNSASRSELIR